jgi:UMF1 family MFS transporter
LIIQKYEWFGFASSGQAVPVSFLMVGIWWLGFAQITFRAMPKDEPLGQSHRLVTKGFHELAKTWRAVKQQPYTLRYLTAFFFYSAGAQTVLFLASAFAGKELKFETQELILLILLLQLVGIAGAYLFAYISKLKGNKFSLVSILIIWVIVCVTAYFSYTKLSFYGVAAMFGMVMGGIQSMSRSTYSKLLPEHTEDTTSYFSFYDVLEKLAIVLGTFCFGYMDQLTGSMRSSVLVIIVFFVIGLAILLTVKVQAAKGTGQLGTGQLGTGG